MSGIHDTLYLKIIMFILKNYNVNYVILENVTFMSFLPLYTELFFRGGNFYSTCVKLFTALLHHYIKTQIL